MEMPRLVGIIGFGAIGRDLCGRLLGEGYGVVTLLRDASPSRIAVPGGVAIVGSADALIAARPALVVEAAGQAAVADVVAPLLAAGIPVVAASTGALADAGLLDRLAAAARAGGTRLMVPAGALGGLDYLAALHGTAGTRIRYTSRKPPAAWAGELAALGHAGPPAGEIVLFEGSPHDAARLFPRNLNAGLTVALAAGTAHVTVRVVADPAVTLNTHEIEVDGPLGLAVMRFANRPAPGNPKTSALTAASMMAAARRFFAPVAM